MELSFQLAVHRVLMAQVGGRGRRLDGYLQPVSALQRRNALVPRHH